MTQTTTDLTALLQKPDQGDLQRSIAQAVPQLMMKGGADGAGSVPAAMNGPNSARPVATVTATAFFAHVRAR